MGVIMSIMIVIFLPSATLAETPIAIDGYYDDWTDKPHTSVTNGTAIHSVSLFLADGSLYGHIKMSNSSGQFISYNNIMDLLINNQYTIPFDINKYNVKKLDLGNLPVGRTLTLATFDNIGRKDWLGGAAITVYASTHSVGDDVEFSINLETTRSICGNIPVDQMQTFTLSCPNLGSQTITSTGTSTAPYIGIIVSIAIVGLILRLRKKRYTVK